MRKTDLLWAFAYPLYQLIGTFRHEASHVLFGWLGGAHINKFVFWPSIQEGGGFTWGHVEWSGNITWVAIAAPYFVDLITFLVFFWLCMSVTFKSRWLWVNAVVIGLISPFVNSLYNYWGGLSSMNDVGRLLLSLPDIAIHLYFIMTLLIYIIGVIVVFRFYSMAHNIGDG